MTGVREAEELWERHHEVAPYPPGVVPVPALIERTAFFPGGRGLWYQRQQTSAPWMPRGGFMILGHDFHSEAGYRESFDRGYEPKTQPTWRNLLSLLDRARIDPTQCFFTNVYMGLRSGTATTGKFPGATNPAFVERCLAFLRTQLDVLQPRVVLTLGRFVPPLIGRLSDDLAAWRGAASLRRIDDAGGPIVHEARISVPSGFVTPTVIALTHPSLRHLSVERRKYRNFKGDAAELALLAEACRAFPVYQTSNGA